ncbi:uncharacterized protein LOC119039176 isoform X4 [Artibeus jamaicensis]|uniref:uncharacterized protein LOC119039176 isoform X4 n=1 Tax=Artibeus jamaicensis TaxID=9417 RepID=UPI00235B0DE2|nr:uncharacterized protein LOC119039176 isoform X4 [Artibeus jamaicensis]
MDAETERIKKEIRHKSAPFCVKCGITRPYRIVILTCAFTGSALLWWAFSLPTWVKIEIQGTTQALFSALFAICSGEVTCWVPPSKSSVCVFLALLLHSLHISKVTDVFKNAKITFLYPCFILSFSITLFFLSGILCFFSSHHCWLQCVLPQPIQVEPRQTAAASGSPVAVTEGRPGGDS